MATGDLTDLDGGDSGSTLVALLAAFDSALKSMHKGASRPSYAVAGTKWLDDSADPVWTLNVFDGTQDVPIGQIDSGTHLLTPFLGATPLSTWATKNAAVVRKSSSHTVVDADDGKTIALDTSGGNLDLNLLSVTSRSGFRLNVRNIGTNSFVINVRPNGAEQINGLGGGVVLPVRSGEVGDLVVGDTENLVALSGGPETGLLLGVPVPYFGLSLPSGTLWANGAEQSRVTYQNLFHTLSIRTSASRTSSSQTLTGIADTSLIRVGMPVSGTGIPSSTTVLTVSAGQITISNAATSTGTDEIQVCPCGVGDGSTTFNMPDLRGVVPAGIGNMGGAADRSFLDLTFGADASLRIGATAGVEKVTLTAAQSGRPGVTVPVTGFVETYFAKVAQYEIGGGTPALNSPGSGQTVVANHSLEAIVPSVGASSAHHNTQPTLLCNWVMAF